jgi:hypothetical protein
VLVYTVYIDGNKVDCDVMKPHVYLTNSVRDTPIGSRREVVVLLLYFNYCSEYVVNIFIDLYEVLTV